MNSDTNPPNSGTSIPPGRSKLVDSMNEEIGSSRPKRQRGKIDPTRVQGAWVISDASRIALEASELFEDLTREQRMEVAALVEEYTVEPGELLLNEGDPAQYIIIIAEGRGVAQIKTDSGWLSLGLVGPKDACRMVVAPGGEDLPGFGQSPDPYANRTYRGEEPEAADEPATGDRVPNSPATEHDIPPSVRGGVEGPKSLLTCGKFSVFRLGVRT